MTVRVGIAGLDRPVADRLGALLPMPRIKELERSAKQVHALMNNNYSNYSVKNAQQLQKLLDAWQK